MQAITETWTYNHKTLMALVAVTVALLLESGLWQVYKPDVLQPDVIAYEQQPNGLDQEIEARARELYTKNEQLDLERYRQEAIQELLRDLQVLSENSPFVDYQALKEKYGY